MLAENTGEAGMASLVSSSNSVPSLLILSLLEEGAYYWDWKLFLFEKLLGAGLPIE